MAGRICAGMGGWAFPPWRGVFYPTKLRQADELAWASRKVSAIEINATYHSLQTRESFARWAGQTPDDFVFTVKGSRFCTNRRILAGAGEAIERFFSQGLAAMGEKLGPILWQLMPTKKFDPADLGAFMRLLPEKSEGLRLRHCIEARHASFVDPRFVGLAREHGVAICLSDSEAWSLIPDITADFVYARLMRGRDEAPTCYRPREIAEWGRRLALYAQGETPGNLAAVAPDRQGLAPREVFAFFIRGGKVRAPAGAMALMRQVRPRSRSTARKPSQ